MSGFSASLSGVRASFFRQRVTGNNVANVNVLGVRREMTDSLLDLTG